MALYKVLKDGIRQRTAEGGFSRPSAGEIIKVSDIAAPRLLAQGWIGPHGERKDDEGGGRKERKAKRSFLSLGKSEAPAQPDADAADLEKSEAPAAPATGDAPKEA